MSPFFSFTYTIIIIASLNHSIITFKLSSKRPMHFAELKLLDENISIRLTPEESKFWVEMSLDFQPIDNSINTIPIMMPKFYNRRITLQTPEGSVPLPITYQRHFLQLDYYNQFFIKNTVYRLTISGDRLFSYGKYGLQMRDYMNSITRESDTYFFTNLYPFAAHDLVPNSNNKLMNSIVYYMRCCSTYKQITTREQELSPETSFIIRSASVEDLMFLITRNIISIKYESNYIVHANPNSNNQFPHKLRFIADESLGVFKDYSQFLNKVYKDKHEGMSFIMLPVLNIKPLAVGLEMCLIDEDIVLTQPENRKFYMTICMIHQYFSAYLKPYSPDIYFIEAGLRKFYSLDRLSDKGERHAKVIYEVLEKEAIPGEGIKLNYYGSEMPEEKKEYYGKKAMAFICLLKYIVLNKEDFDAVVMEFLNKGMDYTLYTFASALKTKSDEFHLPPNLDFISIFRTWSNSTGYPLIYTSVKNLRVFLETKLLRKTLKTIFHYPIILKLMPSNRLLASWLNSALKYDFGMHPDEKYYYVSCVDTLIMYRVNYEISNWDYLLANFEDIQPLDKGFLISNAYFFALRNELDLKYTLSFLRKLSNETNPVVWRAIEYIIIDLDRRFRFSNIHKPFLTFLRFLSAKFYDSLKEHKSGLAIMIACLAHNKKCLDESYKRTQTFINAEQEMENRDYILCGGMRNMDDEYYDYLLKNANTSSKTQFVILMAMTCQEKPLKIRKFIRTLLIRNEIIVKKQFKLKLLLNAFMASETGAHEFWSMFDASNDVIFQTLDRRKFHMLIIMFSRYLKTKVHYRTLDHILTIFQYPKAEILKNVEDNILFIKRQEKNIINAMQ